MSGGITPPKEVTAPTPLTSAKTKAVVVNNPASSDQTPSGLPAWIAPRLHSVNEAAKILHMSARQVHRLIADGRLPACHIGRAVRVRPEALAALMTGGDRR